jgi:hypothetical protein
MRYAARDRAVMMRDQAVARLTRAVALDAVARSLVAIEIGTVIVEDLEAVRELLIELKSRSLLPSWRAYQVFS